MAFASSDNVKVRFNTFYRPRTWLIRILRENDSPLVSTPRDGAFTDNIVVFRSDEMALVAGAQAFATPDFDGFQQIVNAVAFTEANGHSWGRYALAALKKKVQPQ